MISLYTKVILSLSIYNNTDQFNVLIFSFFITVGITWEDAPEDQYAVIHKDSKIRCVVKARPAATVDWLKESLIISTGKHPFIIPR